MPDYNFLNLSPIEFEDLSRDLLQQHFDITFESFTAGKDDGIDLRYSLSNNKSIIVQCKRYSDYNSLYNNFKKEVLNLKDLKPDRYIVMTSVGLTPSRKTEIIDLFSPYIINTSDIFGRDEMNNLLGLYPEVERQHFKLWLSSTNILEKILHSKIHNQSNFEVEKIEETINVYVDNESYYEALKIIKEKRYVIISGIPGIGKTTLARILVFHYLANSFEEFVYLSDSIDDAFALFKEGKKQVFLFDDFLGTNFLENKLSNNEEQRIVRFIEKVSKSNDKIIILTTREYILAQAKQKYDVFNNPSLEFAKCVIDLSQYTKLVRAKILYNHLFFSNLPEEHILSLVRNQNYKKIIEHKNYNPRIIETITNDDIWRTIDSVDFPKKFIEFLQNPQSIWKHVFENQISYLSQIVLVNLMAAGTPILLEDLKVIVQNFAKNFTSKYGVVYNELQFNKSLRELENTFIKISKDESNRLKVDYQNPSVQDFLVFYFRGYPDYITDILKTTNCFNQIFKIFSFKEDFDYAISNRILLTEEQSDIAISRIINDFDYLNSSVLKGYSRNFEKEHFSDFIKLNEIVKFIDLEKNSIVREMVLARFKSIMFAGNTQMYTDEMSCYINLVDEFQVELISDIEQILEKVAGSIVDLNEFEEFERFEGIFGERYMKIISTNELHRKRISTLMSLQIEHEDDDLEGVLEEYVNRAKKYNLDYSDLKKTIEKKIENKESEEEDEEKIDWLSEFKSKQKENNEKEEELIKNMFDSFNTIEKPMASTRS